MVYPKSEQMATRGAEISPQVRFLKVKSMCKKQVPFDAKGAWDKIKVPADFILYGIDCAREDKSGIRQECERPESNSGLLMGKRNKFLRKERDAKKSFAESQWEHGKVPSVGQTELSLGPLKSLSLLSETGISQARKTG